MEYPRIGASQSQESLNDHLIHMPHCLMKRPTKGGSVGMGQRTGPRSPSEITAEETLECRRGVLVYIHSWADEDQSVALHCPSDKAEICYPGSLSPFVIWSQTTCPPSPPARPHTQVPWHYSRTWHRSFSNAPRPSLLFFLPGTPTPLHRTLTTPLAKSCSPSGVSSDVTASEKAPLLPLSLL